MFHIEKSYGKGTPQYQSTSTYGWGNGGNTMDVEIQTFVLFKPQQKTIKATVFFSRILQKSTYPPTKIRSVSKDIVYINISRNATCQCD